MSISNFPVRLLFRAEISPDHSRLKELIGQSLGADRLLQTSVSPEGQAPVSIPQTDDTVLAFDVNTRAELSALILSMSSVVDGQRMLQTLDMAEHYNGQSFSDDQGRSWRILDLLGPEYDMAGKTYMKFCIIPEEALTAVSA